MKLCWNYDKFTDGIMEKSMKFRPFRLVADSEPELLYLEWTNKSRFHSKNIATILHPGKPTDIKFVAFQLLL